MASTMRRRARPRTRRRQGEEGGGTISLLGIGLAAAIGLAAWWLRGSELAATAIGTTPAAPGAAPLPTSFVPGGGGDVSMIPEMVSVGPPAGPTAPPAPALVPTPATPAAPPAPTPTPSTLAPAIPWWQDPTQRAGVNYAGLVWDSGQGMWIPAGAPAPAAPPPPAPAPAPAAPTPTPTAPTPIAVTVPPVAAAIPPSGQVPMQRAVPYGGTIITFVQVVGPDGTEYVTLWTPEAFATYGGAPPSGTNVWTDKMTGARVLPMEMAPKELQPPGWVYVGAAAPAA